MKAIRYALATAGILAVAAAAAAALFVSFGVYNVGATKRPFQHAGEHGALDSPPAVGEPR